MPERLRRMLVKEFLQVFRDPRMRAIIFFIPVFQTLVFGYAVTTDAKYVPTAICDLDGSVESRDLAAHFVRSGVFEVSGRVSDLREAQGMLDRGEVQVVLHMAPGFGADLGAGRPARLQVLLDGTDSNIAGIALQYAGRIARRFSQEALAARQAKRRGPGPLAPVVEVRTRAWYNENLESRNFFVPGVIALLVSLVTLLLTSMAIVREKEIGTMEQIMVTPISRWEFILGKTIPFALIALVDMALVAAVGTIWFAVPFRGSFWLLALSTAVYILTTLGVGLFLSTVSATQQQAMMSTFFFFFPAMLLSGFVFPIANMPEAIQWVTYLDPIRYFLVILRGIFLKGSGLAILWPHLLALLAMGVAIFALSVQRFKKTLA